MDPEEEGATTLDPWTASGRAPWEKHSEMGPNLRPLPSAPEAAPWMPNINPPDYNWDARWLDIDVSALRSLMDVRRDMDVEYVRPDLSKEALGVPYLLLFQDIVLKHVDYVLQHLDDSAAIKLCGCCSWVQLVQGRLHASRRSCKSSRAACDDRSTREPLCAWPPILVVLHITFGTVPPPCIVSST